MGVLAGGDGVVVGGDGDGAGWRMGVYVLGLLFIIYFLFNFI